MAVDTRQKRMSMLNFGTGPHWHVTFEADSSVDLDDRQHLIDCYSGIAFANQEIAVDTVVHQVYLVGNIGQLLGRM